MLPPYVQRAIQRLEGLVAEYDALPVRVERKRAADYMDLYEDEERTIYPESPVLMSRMRQAIKEIAPNSVYCKNALQWSQIRYVRAEAEGLCQDLKDGYLSSLHEQAHAEVFDDLLDRAEYLLDNGDKDPAAVLAGSVAESHLKQLAAKHGVTTVGPNGKPLMGNALNQELAKASVYDANTMKLLTAWQGIRNSAAHGSFGEYDAIQVRTMILGIRGVMASHPA